MKEVAITSLKLYHTILAKIICTIIFVSLIYYFVSKSNSIGFLLFGVMPVFFTGRLIFSVNIRNEKSLDVCLPIVAGFLIATFPLLIYHLVNHSVIDWFDDVIMSAVGLVELPFIRRSYYDYMLMNSLTNVIQGSLLISMNGIFWTSVLLAPSVLGLSAIIRGFTKDKRLSALAIIPVYYSIVSVHYQIPIYLFYSTSLTLVSILHIYSDHTKISSVFAVFLIFMSTVAFIFHAAQPVSRGIDGTLKGERVLQNTHCAIPHCSLIIEHDSAVMYRRIISLVLENTTSEDSILTIPSNPEINYFSKRKSPLPHFNTGVSLATSADVEGAISILDREKPKLVFYNQYDKYNTKVTNSLIEYVHSNYKFLAFIGDLQVFIDSSVE